MSRLFISRFRSLRKAKKDFKKKVVFKSFIIISKVNNFVIYSKEDRKQQKKLNKSLNWSFIYES